MPHPFTVVTIGISLVRAIVEEVSRQGHDATELLTRAGIAAATVADPSARIEAANYDRLQELALEATGDPALGIHMGERGSTAAFSLLGPLALQCETLRDGLNVLVHYHRIVADAPAPSLLDDGEDLVVVYQIVKSPLSPACNRLRSEFGLTRLTTMARTFVTTGLPVSGATFEHAAPDYAAEYTRIFGGTERFDQPSTTLRFPKALLESRQVHHDARIVQLLKGQADDWLQRLLATDGLSGKLRRLVVDTYPEHDVSSDALARRLGMSSRSLRRGLQAEGTTFQGIVRDALGQLACSMLREPNTTIQEIAVRLGFSEPSAFHRAFKRWTGLTPHEWRKSASNV